MRFKLDNPCTFKSVYPFISIDKNGKPFYSFEFNGNYFFNLPKGVYTLIDGDFEEVDLSIKWDVQLPEYERDYKMPKKVYVKFDNTPFKAHIYRNSRQISINKEYKGNEVFVDFLKFHEVGHYHYETEEYCDLFAAKAMLEKGYNPSQIYDAIFEMLGDDRELAQERIDYIGSKINKNAVSK